MCFSYFCMFALIIYVPVNIFFCHVTKFSFFPGLNQYYPEDKVSCSRTQNRDSGKSPTSNLSITSLTGFIQASLSKIQGLLKDFPTVFKDKL